MRPLITKTNVEMDRLGLKYGTDKNSACHGYTFWYDFLFRHVKNDPINILEIGVWEGTSLRMWKDYFPNAKITAVDVNQGCSKHIPEGVTFVIADQEDTKQMQQVGEKYGPFDIVIDDGGHHMIQQQNSFLTLFPQMAPNGVYVIEDIFTSNYPMFKPKFGELSTYLFLYGLAEHLQMPGTTFCCGNIKEAIKDPNVMTKTLELVEAVIFLYGAGIVIKRDLFE